MAAATINFGIVDYQLPNNTMTSTKSQSSIISFSTALSSALTLSGDPTIGSTITPPPPLSNSASTANASSSNSSTPPKSLNPSSTSSTTLSTLLWSFNKFCDESKSETEFSFTENGVSVFERRWQGRVEL
ncbi:hypothetical protein ACSBR2_004885 [Camellia fascicularis]